jgi:hypothetical protein
MVREVGGDYAAEIHTSVLSDYLCNIADRLAVHRSPTELSLNASACGFPLSLNARIVGARFEKG